jgi:hypothetical protein
MLRAAAFIGGEGALVAGGNGGTTLQCRHGRGKVRATSNWDNGGGWEGLTMKRRGAVALRRKPERRGSPVVEAGEAGA